MVNEHSAMREAEAEAAQPARIGAPRPVGAGWLFNFRIASWLPAMAKTAGTRLPTVQGTGNDHGERDGCHA